ncbi:substrate-binding domain-containing protein [Streptomyces sp. NPDC093064]|uniref:substrate-binding domain-containing protein n=1 Tax=Streptomyces sp. NPDC093064 TaxID=3366020 RepID=UPI0038166D4E
MDRFDPRGRVNRALLVGVWEYEHTQPDDPEGVPGHLPAVRHNLERLEDVLRRGGIFGGREETGERKATDGQEAAVGREATAGREDTGDQEGAGGQDAGGSGEVTVLPSPSLDQFSEALRTAAQDADGLLLCYFAGHGAVPSAGDELFLQMRNARVVAGGRAVFPGAEAFTGMLTVLAGSRAERIVVILDCCYAGNAAKVWHDFADRRRILLLMSVQANRLIDSGDGTRATPFTEELAQLLDSNGELSFLKLFDRLRGQMLEAGRRTPLGDLWEPQFAGEPGTDVLLAAREGEPVREGEPEETSTPAPDPGQSSEEPAPSAQSSTQPPRTEPPGGQTGTGPRTGTGGPVRLLVALFAVSRARARAVIDRFVGLRTRARVVVSALLVLALAALGAGGYELVYPGGGHSCAPPLELRLLTDPDLEPTVRAAADAYLTSRANTTGHGCRRSGLTVYSAGATAAVTALRRQSDAWQEPRVEDTNPQRDVGPQPDVWIPASGTDAARVTTDWTTRSYVELHPDGEPFAYSPVVLAVPQNLAGAGLDERVGLPLSGLIANLRKQDANVGVLRPDPEFTDSALLATIGLYGGTADSRAAEQAVRPARPPSPTAAELLCALPADRAADGLTAALVPEFLLRSGVGCARTTRVPRIAEYPADVPALTPTFVRVRWEGGDRDAAARDDTVDRFRTWLIGEEGLAAFAADGFRSATESGHRLLDADHAGVGVLRGPSPLPGAARRTAMEEALTRYRSAHGPGRVLYLLDSSGSMSTQWPGPSGGPGILKQSLGGLGAQDDYGVWAVYGTSGDQPYQQLLPFGHHRRTDAEHVVDAEAQVRDAEADPHAALLAALDDMAGRGTDDQRPQLIVYITDDEDSDRLTGKNLDEVLARARKAKVPVDMVSLISGSCDTGRPDARIAEASGGRCLDAGDDPGRGLRDEVARVGTGEH